MWVNMNKTMTHHRFLKLGMAFGALALGMASLAQAAPDSGIIALRPSTALKPEPITTVSSKDLVKRRLCVWDILGKNGEIYAKMKDYQIKAATWGIDFEVKPYTDERIANDDFRVRYCDAVLITGIRTRSYNAFMGSIEAVGALPTYDHMRTLTTVLNSPAAARYMSTDIGGQPYEVAGVMPFGAAYGFVRDRTVNNPERLPGKKIAVLDYDKAENKLVKVLGAQPDPSDISNFGDKFNNGVVDIVVAPATAYRPLELYRGIGTSGGIVNYVLAQVSIQIVIHKDRFPADFGQKSRDYIGDQYDSFMKTVKSYESEVAPTAWIPVSETERRRYQDMARTARLDLLHDGIYDAHMLNLMHKIRCQKEPTLAECSQAGE